MLLDCVFEATGAMLSAHNVPGLGRHYQHESSAKCSYLRSNFKLSLPFFLLSGDVIALGMLLSRWRTDGGVTVQLWSGGAAAISQSTSHMILNFECARFKVSLSTGFNILASSR
jgi:hypothetical protein